MDKKIVLVTGASSGIGMAIAKEFFNLGFTVYGTSRQPEKVDKEQGGVITFLALDITDATSRDACIEQIFALEGKLDILVNNAGYGQMGPLSDLPDEVMLRQFETNMLGPASLTKLVLRAMIRQKSGMIVNISSISGVMPSAFAGAYCSSKAAMNAWSDTLRIELKPFGIQVITVQPGAIRSNFGNMASKNLSFDKLNTAYAPISDFIRKRAMISQEGATDAEEFARRLIRKLVKKKPKSIIRIGKSSILYPLMKRWLPTHLLDAIISSKFGLTKLRQSLDN
jgi:NAD(P)-dependent dehydrogenase (short-subunit alcohol dehydrogenase family)